MLYGVGRISTGKQNIERQVRNILAKYPNARIIKETYTGTKLEGRKEFENLLNIEIEKLKNKLIVIDINDILRIMGYDV